MGEPGGSGRASPDLLPASPTASTSPIPLEPTHDPQHSDAHDAEEPPAKVRRISSPSPPDDQDGETCPICLEPWGTSGDHRLVALKCGHLFGSACVLRWLKAQSTKERSCPTCKASANLRDVRCIYARRLVAADTDHVTALQKQIDTLIAEKSRTELELQKSNIAHRACTMQLEVLRSLMKSQATKEQPVRKPWRFALDKNIEISKDGGCRVLTYNCRTYELYVSQKNSNCLFPGYGIRKVNCLDYSLGQFVYLHPKPIRDITYSQPRDLLLSVGLDSTARIVERGIPGMTVQSRVPLWSCAWDHLRSHELYAGGVGGAIYQYDVRNPATHLRALHSPDGDRSPVVALSSTEHGLLSCQLNSCKLWCAADGSWEPRPLPAEGAFASLCYDRESHRVAVSSRPNGLEGGKVTVCRLKSALNGVTVDVEESFAGSSRVSLMCRAAVVKVPGCSWVGAYSESAAATVLHGLDGNRSVSLPCALPALDLCSVEVNGNHLLAALSEGRLRVYRGVTA